MEDRRNEIINKAVNKISELTGEDFHGYRSEIFYAISIAIREASKLAQPTQFDLTTEEGCKAFIMGIEEAHKRAANSNLYFGE